MIILAIDPSVNNLGWATFNPLNDNFDYGVLHPEGENRAFTMCNVFARLQKKLGLCPQHVTDLVAEYPTFFSSGKGAVAATMGWTHDLAYCCGYFAGRLQLPAQSIHLYLPNEWKGTQPKTATQFRFRRMFGPVEAASTSEHAVDATMMLVFHLRKKGILS